MRGPRDVVGREPIHSGRWHGFFLYEDIKVCPMAHLGRADQRAGRSCRLPPSYRSAYTHPPYGRLKSAALQRQILAKVSK